MRERGRSADRVGEREGRGKDGEVPSECDGHMASRFSQGLHRACTGNQQGQAHEQANTPLPKPKLPTPDQTPLSTVGQSQSGSSSTRRPCHKRRATLCSRLRLLRLLLPHQHDASARDLSVAVWDRYRFGLLRMQRLHVRPYLGPVDRLKRYELHDYQNYHQYYQATTYSDGTTDFRKSEISIKAIIIKAATHTCTYSARALHLDACPACSPPRPFTPAASHLLLVLLHQRPRPQPPLHPLLVQVAHLFMVIRPVLGRVPLEGVPAPLWRLVSSLGARLANDCVQLDVVQAALAFAADTLRRAGVGARVEKGALGLDNEVEQAVDLVRGGAAVGGEADNGKHVGLERVEDGKDRVVDLECLDPLRALGPEEDFLFLECRQSGQHGAGRAGDTWEAKKTHLGTTLLDALALAFLEKLEQVIHPRRVGQLNRERHFCRVGCKVIMAVGQY